MKKRKNIIISAITCMMSICLMMFGVYAASNPSVSISGQVSYSARDAKVLVLGKVNGQAGEESNVEYPSVADSTNPQEDEKKVSASQYMGFTNGTGVNDETDDLAPWAMNTTHAFYEDSTGIRPIKISFMLRNLSNYPVVATVDFTGVTDANLASKNLTRETTGITDDNKVYLDKGRAKEISITYAVANDAVGVNGDGLLNMSIMFEKTVLESTTEPVPVQNTKCPQGETMQSDWEYLYDNQTKSFTITRYKKIKPLDDETFEDPTIPSELVIPSSVICTDGKTYPVKTLGKLTEEELASNDDIFETCNTGSLMYNLLEYFTDPRHYGENFPQNVEVSEGIEILNCYALTGTAVKSLPSSIKEVHSLSCVATKLENLNLKNLTYLGDQAFGSCPNLKTVSLSNEIDSIPEYAFTSCTSLESITIPDSVKTIKSNAFSECVSLTSITLPQNLESIESDSFDSCVRLAEVINLSNINISQFYEKKYTVRTATSGTSKIQNNDGFKFVVGDDNNYYLIGYFGNEKDIITPTTDFDYKIKEYAFSYSDVTSVILSNSVTGIIDGAFRNCDSLLSVTISNSVTTNYNFSFCVRLSEIINLSNASISVDSDIKSRGIRIATSGESQIKTENGFKFLDLDGQNYLLGYYGEQNLKDGDVSLPQTSSNYKIKAYSFYRLDMPETLLIPNCVDYIGDYAFAYSGVNYSVVISDSVTYIGDTAFSYVMTDNLGIENITIGANVTEIGGYIGCSGILTINATKPPKMTNSNFLDMLDGRPSAIYVPAESVELYKNADGWKNYSDIIFAIS